MSKSTQRGWSLAIAAVFPLVGAAGARGDTAVTWANSAGGNWSTSSDWSGGVVPNNGASTYAVTLPTLGSYAVELDVAATIDSLTVDGFANLTLLTNPLTVTGNVNVGADGKIEGTDSSSQITVDGTFSSVGGSLYMADGVANLQALGSFGALDAPGGTINITGGGSGITDIADAESVLITGSGAIDVINSGVSSNGLANLATLEGALEVNSSGQATINGSLTISSTGIVQVDESGALTIKGGVTNSGFVSDFVTSISSNGELTVDGTFTNEASGILLLTASGGVTDISALDNLGSVTVGVNNTLNLTGGGSGITDVAANTKLSVGGTINVINSSVSTNGLANLATVEGTFDVLVGSATVNGPLAISSTGTVYVDSAGTLTDSGNMNNSGTVYTGKIAGGNTLNVDGTLTNNSTGTITLNSSGDLATIGTLSNSGSVTINGGATMTVTGNVSNSNQISTGTVSGNNTLNVDGTLTNHSGGTLALGASGDQATIATLSNSGSVTINGGAMMIVTGNVSNASQMSTGSVSGNNTLTVDGTFLNFGGATVNLYSSGDVANIGTLDNSGNFNIDSGAALNLTAVGNGITDVPAGSGLSVDGTVTNNGGTASNGLANLSTVEGTIYIANGQSMNVTGPLSVSHAGFVNVDDGTTLTVTGNVNNSGTFYTGYSKPNNTVNVGGTFTNNDGATLWLVSTGDVVTAPTLANGGAVNINTGALLGVGGSSFSATSGYQQLSAGTLNEFINGVGDLGLINDLDGPAVLDGTLEVTLTNGFVPTVGQSFLILEAEAGELSGTFAGDIVNGSFAGGQWQVVYDDAAGTVTLDAVAVPEPATVTAILGLAGMYGLRRPRRRAWGAGSSLPA